ncbi:MAG: DUF1302 domain-containing protein [Deltaproteobacteria bacterium]|nr:DUF1302 domain-containing protein [Deltaproteobacteria bacterium]
MRKKSHKTGSGRTLAFLLGALAGAAGLTWASRADALTLYDRGGVRANLDTTLSYGLQWRVFGRDERLIGAGNGGEAAGVNHDDGDLNYDKGLVSNLFKVISELDLRTKRAGLFLRGTAFYDFENMHGDRERYELSDEAEEQVGRDVRLLDGYVWGAADLGRFPVQLRVGEQVVNWGESTFIANSIGINTINPVDLSKLRTPGAELRDALLPEGLVWGSVGLTNNVGLEGLYLYDWEEMKFDEPGTYWSFADFIGDAGQKVVLSNIPDNLDAPANQTFFGLARAGDKKPDKQGQFGAALRYTADWLKNTELSFYYLRYHSKAPTLTIRSGTAQGEAAGNAAAAAVFEQAGVIPGADPQVDAQAQAAFLDTFIKTMRYRAEYQENINLYGLGWSTEIFGWGFQGEVSYRPDVALQIEDTEILTAALSSVVPDFGGINQVGSFVGQFETWMPSTVKRDMTQVQFTISKLLGAVLGAQGSAVLAEFGWLHVHGMPDKDEVRLETYGPFGTGNPAIAAAFGLRLHDADFFPDADSFGYVLFGKLDYENLIGPVTVSPKVAWSHDVRGTSPNGGPFLEGRKAITLGLEGRYLQNWTAEVSYTNFFGAGERNLHNDRDFIGVNVKYYF